MKLYKLTNKIGDYWVVAEDASTAEGMLLKTLSDADYGLFSDRVVTKFEVIAECIKDVKFITGKFLIV